MSCRNRSCISSFPLLAPKYTRSCFDPERTRDERVSPSWKALLLGEGGKDTEDWALEDDSDSIVKGNHTLRGDRSGRVRYPEGERGGWVTGGQSRKKRGGKQ